MKPKKYFHELTREEFKNYIDQKITWKKLAKKHPQPIWCKFSDPIEALGCWGLIYFHVDKEGKYCERCEFKEV